MPSSNSKTDFLHVFLPYCLIRLQDGRYAVTNRQYKPLGSTSVEWVDYETLDATGRVDIPAHVAAQLDHRGEPGDGHIYLYSDGSIPTRSDAAWAAYAQRLALLARHTAK